MDLKLLPCQLPSQSTCRNGPRLGWVINVATEMIIVNVITTKLTSVMMTLINKITTGTTLTRMEAKLVAFFRRRSVSHQLSRSLCYTRLHFLVGRLV